MKITEDIHVVLDESAGENCGYKYNVKFLSLEGYDICWKKEEAEQLKQQIIENQENAEKWQKCHDVLNGKTGKTFVQWYDESQANKEKLEKIKKELHSFYEDDTNFVDFTAKLKELLGAKHSMETVKN